VNLYAARANLIQNAWETNTIPRAAELLDQQVPKAGEEDLRGLEWHYWNRQLHAALRSWPLPRQFNWGHYVTLSSDGKRLAAYLSGNRENPGWIVVWNTTTGKEVALFDPKLFDDAGPGGPVSVPMLSSDGTRLAIANVRLRQNGNDGRMGLFDATTGKLVRRWEGLPGWSSEPVISPDNTRIARAMGSPEDPENAIHVWDTRTGKDVLTIKAYGGKAIQPTFSHDGSRLATVVNKEQPPGKGSLIKVWDAATGRDVLAIDAGRGE
jgi:WD40 repeat protein